MSAWEGIKAIFVLIYWAGANIAAIGCFIVFVRSDDSTRAAAFFALALALMLSASNALEMVP